MRNWGPFGSLGQAGKNVYLHLSSVSRRQVRVHVRIFQNSHKPSKHLYLEHTWPPGPGCQKCVPASPTCLSQTRESASTHFPNAAPNRAKTCIWSTPGHLGKAAKNVYLHPSPVCHRQVRVQVHIFQRGFHPWGKLNLD